MVGKEKGQMRISCHHVHTQRHGAAHKAKIILCPYDFHLPSFIT
jgi:hypothetical protein